MTVRRRPPLIRPKQAIRLNSAQLSRLVAGYQSGSTVYELAAQFGISRKTVARRLKGVGVAMHNSGHVPTASEVHEMVRLYESGLSLEAVGQRLGFVARTVQRHLDERGVQRRDTHGRERL